MTTDEELRRCGAALAAFTAACAQAARCAELNALCRNKCTQLHAEMRALGWTVHLAPLGDGEAPAAELTARLVSLRSLRWLWLAHVTAT
jgi:hypothetical protein